MSLPVLPARVSRRPRRRLRLALALAAAVAAGSAAAAVAVSRPAPGSAPGPTQSRRPPTDSAGRVPSRAPGTSVSTAAWQAAVVDGAVVPISPADGPERNSGGLASGFTDTQAGAVLAAVNIAVRIGGQLGPDVFVPTIGRQVTGPGAPALLTGAWQEYAAASAQRPPASGAGPAGTVTAAVTSFRLASWTPAAAAVALVSAADGSSQAQVAIGVQVRWSGRDWQMLIPASGTLAAQAAAARVPAGFTALPGR